MTVIEAYDLLQSTCPHLVRTEKYNRFRRGGRFRVGNLSFAQLGSKSTTPGRDGKTIEHVKCHGCHEHGHYRNQCPNNNVTLAKFVLNQQELATINPNWVLLDTCSTVSVYCNPQLVHNITPCEPHQELQIITNGGQEFFAHHATSNLVPLPVHFNSKSLANILSLSDVANIPGAKVTMDTSVERAIKLHLQDKVITFNECKDGLYYHDTSSNTINDSNVSLLPYSCDHNLTLLQSVKQNKSLHTKKQIEGADAARQLQTNIGYPSTTTFKQMISNNLIRNCGVTVDDVSRAERIYGPLTPILQGKATRPRPKRVQVENLPLPLQIEERYKNVDLHIDFFYVNGLPFLHTKADKIHFLTV